MSRLLQFVATLLFGLLSIANPGIAQGKKVALVIGNSQYQFTAKLENPRNDAADMATVLKKLGFAVIEGRDLDKAAMDRTVRDFAKGLAGAQVGLFFYAGHGLQVSGQNYLVPVDAELTAASAVDFEMVRLDLVHRTMEREAPTNIIMIDACRDNPLARNLARALGTRSTQVQQGFATVESGEGTLISFSTQPGNVALDGKGRNSPYAAALVKHIAVPGDDLPTILINVRNDVMKATARRQVPWEHSAMTAKFYFIPPKSTQGQVELAFWMSVKDSKNAAVLATYLQRYPDGEFAVVARALVEHYDRLFKLERAQQEEVGRLQEEAKRAAEVKRLEDEQKAREAALALERKQVEAAKSKQEAKRREDERAKLIARNEQLQKALDELRKARQATKAAEEQRVAALNAAENAHKTAEDAITKKRDVEKFGDPAKVAALPKIDKGGGSRSFDGAWIITWYGKRGCEGHSRSYSINIQAGAISGKHSVSGSISSSGAAQWTILNNRGRTVEYSGTLLGKSGSGRFAETYCGGTFVARRH